MRYLIPIIISVLMLSACMKPTSYYPQINKQELDEETRKHAEIVQKQQEEKEKRAEEKKLEHQQRLKKLALRISRGGMELCRMLDKNDQNCLYEFELAEGGEVNAYADGKKIFVTPAMMNFAEKDEELSVVLGHEYAHNLMGHIKSRKTNILIGNVLGAMVDVVAASQGVSTGSAFGKIGASAGSSSFSKEFEKEADYIGLYITAIAGFDIDNAPQFWRKMTTRSSKSVYTATTHPTNPERYLALEKTVQQIKRKINNGAPLVPEVKL